MSDDYTPTTEEARRMFVGGQSWAGAKRAAMFDRWHANERADAVMGFATHYLPYALWVKAKQYADDIREGNA